MAISSLLASARENPFYLNPTLVTTIEKILQSAGQNISIRLTSST
jgi:hypothetical protein